MIPALEYFSYRDRLAGDIRDGLIEPTPEALSAALEQRAGLQPFDAAHVMSRFLGDLGRGLKRRNRSAQ